MRIQIYKFCRKLLENVLQQMRICDSKFQGPQKGNVSTQVGGKGKSHSNSERTLQMTAVQRTQQQIN